MAQAKAVAGVKVSRPRALMPTAMIERRAVRSIRGACPPTSDESSVLAHGFQHRRPAVARAVLNLGPSASIAGSWRQECPSDAECASVAGSWRQECPSDAECASIAVSWRQERPSDAEGRAGPMLTVPSSPVSGVYET
jgi:hypothetical protein